MLHINLKKDGLMKQAALMGIKPTVLQMDTSAWESTLYYVYSHLEYGT